MKNKNSFILNTKYLILNTKSRLSWKTFLGLSLGIILIGLSFSPLGQKKQSELSSKKPSPSPFSIFALVTQITDGDTIKVKRNGKILRIRYLGIDTPELGRGEKEDECFSQQAKEMNQKLVLGKMARLEFDKNKMDRFGRYLAYVYLDTETKEGKKEIFVNKYLLEKGAGEFRLDTVNLKYQDILIQAAEKAHSEKKGLWISCAPDNKGCQVKGNVDRHGHRWYHLPFFRHYSQTVVNPNNGDRWFCTEEQAIKAGFEKARE